MHKIISYKTSGRIHRLFENKLQDNLTYCIFNYFFFLNYSFYYSEPQSNSSQRFELVYQVNQRNSCIQRFMCQSTSFYRICQASNFSAFWSFFIRFSLHKSHKYAQSGFLYEMIYESGHIFECTVCAVSSWTVQPSEMKSSIALKQL